MNTLKNFFYPNSLCLVGASTKEKSIGYEILKCIKDYGFTGKMFPVNPKADEILGFKTYRTIEEIDEPIELAIVVVQKQFVEESVDSLLTKKVRSIILITAGFKEIGKEGGELEKRILLKIKNSGARLIGPNCMGVINTLDRKKLNATFVAEKPEVGSTGFFSQSGALGAAVLNSLRETNIKFAHFISAGNKADVNENDLLHFWQNDDNIKTLAYYLESFVDGKNFILPFLSRDITKPTIVLKAGRTESGMKAASSHTGALSSNDKIIDALLKQSGVIRVENLNELFNTAKGFENFPLPQGNKIAVVTNAGGPAILCVDKIEGEGLSLSLLSNATKTSLRKIVHPEGSVENPIDLLPGATADTYKSVIEIVLQDESVDSVISIFVQPVMVEPYDVVEAVSSIISEKPVLQVVMPLPEFWNYYHTNSKFKQPIFKNPEDPPEVISNMLFYADSQKKIEKNKAFYKSSFSHTIKNAIKKEGYLDQTEINSLCGLYDIPLVKSLFLEPSEIQNVNIDFYPVVLKGINKNVIHKSELSAVKVNLRSKEELLHDSGEILKSFSVSGLVVEKFLVQQFINPKHELLIGGFRDPSFGPIIMFGSGGKYVEVFDDTSIRSCYLCEEDIYEMINSTRIGTILKGIRGEPPVDLAGLKKIINSCARMMLENPNITEFDLNPLIVSGDNKYCAVDIRIKTSAVVQKAN
ncbi:MAG: acetate--CoA ligase family protein [Bacteroidota bacterium]